MDADFIQKKFDRLLELSKKVRYYQKEYNKYKASRDYEKARYYERQLDTFISEEIKHQATKQQDLF